MYIFIHPIPPTYPPTHPRTKTKQNKTKQKNTTQHNLQTVPDEQGGFTTRLNKEALEIGESIGSKAATVEEVAKDAAVRT